MLILNNDSINQLFFCLLKSDSCSRKKEDKEGLRGFLYYFTGWSDYSLNSSSLLFRN